MPPSRNGVQDHSSRITKSGAKRKQKSSNPVYLDQWSSRLRPRRKAPPAQSPEVHLQTKPKTLQHFDPNEAVVSRSAGQNSRPLKRRRAEDDSEEARPESSKQQSPAKRNRLGKQDRERGALGFAGVQAIKPLTQQNLDILQETMPDPDQTPGARSRKDSAPHRRVSALSSSKGSKRSHSATQVSDDGSGSTRAYAPASINFEKCLRDCGLDVNGLERPDQNDLDALRRVMARARDSPEPDSQAFHLTRAKVDTKNEASIAKRLSPMLFPPRDLITNNQMTKNLVYHDDVSWNGWGSMKPGLLPTPKPDLCIAFDETAFTSAELKKMTSPYTNGSSFAPALTLEFKTALQGMKVASRQNANNMIPLLETDYTLQKTNGTEKQMERRIRFVSTAHDTTMQRYDAWFYVFKGDSIIPKWCSFQLQKVDFEDPDGDGFQTARRCNLNYCEYISDTVFKELRNTLAGVVPNAADTQGESDLVVRSPLIQAEIQPNPNAAHLHTPSSSSTERTAAKKRPRRAKKW